MLPSAATIRRTITIIDGKAQKSPHTHCRSPSKIYSTPNPMRSSRRPRGSAAGACAGLLAAEVLVLAAAQASQRSTTTMRAITPWWNSADLNAATSTGSLGLRPEFMPGTGSGSSLYRSAPKANACSTAGLRPGANMSKM